MLNVLACHALTGCDAVPCMFGIGKDTALKVLKMGFLWSVLVRQEPTLRMWYRNQQILLHHAMDVKYSQQ